MREINPSHVKESFTCSLVINWIQKKLLVFLECLKDRAFNSANCLRSFIIIVCKARINYLKLSFFLRYPLMVWSHIITWCSQGGKLSFANTLCTFKLLFCTAISLMSVEHIIWDLIKWIEAVWVFKHFHIFQRGLSFNSYEVIYLWGVDNRKMIEQMCDTRKNNYVYVGWPLCCHLVSVYVGWPLCCHLVSVYVGWPLCCHLVSVYVGWPLCCHLVSVYVGWPLCCHLVSVYVGWPLCCHLVSVYVGWPLCCHLVSVYVGWPLCCHLVSVLILLLLITICWLASAVT